LLKTLDYCCFKFTLTSQQLGVETRLNKLQFINWALIQKSLFLMLKLKSRSKRVRMGQNTMVGTIQGLSIFSCRKVNNNTMSLELPSPSTTSKFKQLPKKFNENLSFLPLQVPKVI